MSTSAAAPDPPAAIATMAGPDAVVLRRAQRLLPGFLATGMSAFVAAVVTTINTGLDAGLPARWLHAWSLALPAAIVAAYLLRPLAWRAALAVARPAVRGGGTDGPSRSA